MFSRLEESTDLQSQTCYLGARSAIHRAEGKLREALVDAEATIEAGLPLGIAQQAVKQAIVEGVEAASSSASRERWRSSSSTSRASRPGPGLRTSTRRRSAFGHGWTVIRPGTKLPTAGFRKLGIPFWLAVTLLERAELTGDDESLAEAREIFEGLKATPWLERAAEIGAEAKVPA